ncbi:hypothetical protein BUALT_Bualt08G0091100 [Buddleja alternifolia]|uniref:Uncharacterized protein n=1 Tax=Buddleja alternifolia TaxID=168488 RepID=A0AAV6XCZ3_9LAMI|nr:hypothetical protein BUALT_Bualt08G0091100 [Buddleja alternifolia]
MRMAKGKSNRHQGKRSSTVVSRDEGEGLGKRGDQWTEILSWQPRAFLYHNFLSKDECEYLINLATPHMTKSTVVDGKTGKSMDSRPVPLSYLYFN